MPENERNSSGSGKDIRWRNSTVVVFVVVALSTVVPIQLIKRSPPVQLPKSIEDYRIALKQPEFGMHFVDFSSTLPPPTGITNIEDAKFYLYEMLGIRSESMGSTENIGNLVANYSAVAGKRVSFGGRWVGITNGVSFDDSTPRTRRRTLQAIEEILRKNGGYVFPLNDTNVVLLTVMDLRDLGHPVPQK